jgi:hexosaminidase
VTAENVDSRIWPRLAVIAERLWSPRDINDVRSMYARLDAVSNWLEWSGVRDRAEADALELRAAGTDGRALRVLESAVQALGIDQRQKARHYNSFVPLNRLADAARPESEQVRRLEETVAELQTNTPARTQMENELRTTFDLWSQNAHELRPLLERRFFLTEAVPVSEDLSRIGDIGLRALQYLESSEQAPRDWLNQAQQDLDRMKASSAEVSLAAVRPVRALLDLLTQAANGRGRSGNAPASH